METNELIRSLLLRAQPAAVGKIGATELKAVSERLAIDSGGRRTPGRSVVEELHVHSGVFPPTSATLIRFADRYTEAAGAMDVLAMWFRPGEEGFVQRYCPAVRLVSLGGLAPFSVDFPWTAALTNKSVLVASPFVDTIARQYERRHLIWPGKPDLLPGFELQLLRLPFSDGLMDTPSPFEDWFQAVDAFIAELERRSFDVLLVGGGAFSFPLIVAAKTLGKVGIHLGGSTQVLFGIRGARWDAQPAIAKFYNEHWTRPTLQERPSHYRKNEDGCYW